MKKNMRRRQFHLSIAEEQTIYELSRQKNISEAEVVRMAIQKLGEMRVENMDNPLVEMANAAKLNDEQHGSMPDDASEHFKEYYMEILNDEHK